MHIQKFYKLHESLSKKEVRESLFKQVVSIYPLIKGKNWLTNPIKKNPKRRKYLSWFQSNKEEFKYYYPRNGITPTSLPLTN